MKQIYKLSVTEEQAKRVRAEIREQKLMRNLRNSTEPSVKLKRALEKYYENSKHVIDGLPAPIDSDM